MDDYSFASEIKFVVTLYLSASSAEYYDWEDAMEDFLWDRDLESRMKIFFVRHTFSASVLQWLIKLQERLINRSEDPCRAWKGMKLVLQYQFDPLIEHPVPKINKIAMTSEKHSFGTKSNVRSSWSDSIIGDVLPTHSYDNKVVATHSQRCHGSEQKLKL
jgi:hypothetical protein